MADTTLVPVEFHGATLYAIAINGVHHVALKPISDALGLDWSAQFRRIKRHAVLAEAIAVMAIPSDGGEQSTIALPLDKLNGWLFGVSVNRVKPELRDKLIQYQRECFDVLARHFLPATPYSVHPGQTLSAEQAEALRNLLTSQVQKLPKAQQGKAMVQGWSKLKAHFGTDYRHIPAGEFHEAVSIIARHTAEWDLVDEAPKLPNDAAPIDPINAPAMVAAHRVAIDYMNNFRASVREGKPSPSMGEIPTAVLQGILSEAIMRQRMLVSFNPDTGRIGCTVLGGNEFISDWPRLVKDVATGECMRTSAELLDMAAACMQRLQQRGGPARLAA